MGKKAKKGRTELPKRLLGVKIAKDIRHQIARTLAAMPPGDAQAPAEQAVAAMLAACAAPRDADTTAVIEMFPSREIRLRGRNHERFQAGD